MKLLFVSATSACMELSGNTCFYAEKEYEVILNGEKQKDKRRENVFSLFDLKPNSEYTVVVGKESVSFRTLAETVCINVRARGAVGDGETDDTGILQGCIDDCPDGGRIYVPKGVYRVLPLRLKSNITLELAKDATLLGETAVKKYPIRPAYIIDDEGNERLYSAFEGEAVRAYESLIHGDWIENVNIIGQGTIDGNGYNSTWWTEEWKKSEQARPRLVYLNQCKNIRFHGITGQNSASWTFHPIFSENIDFLDLTINSPELGPNTDGMDPEGCDGVRIIGCRFSTGDDCIAIKSGKRELAEAYNRPAIRHVIRNCYMHYGHGAVVLGSEIGAGVRELSVSQCYFHNTERGVRIKTRRGRGKLCVLDELTFENIKMDGVQTPFVINMFYNCGVGGNDEYVWSRELCAVDDNTPYIGSIAFKNIDCVNTECIAGFFDGLPERPIKSVKLENVRVHFSENAQETFPASQTQRKYFCRAGLYFDNVDNVDLNNVNLENVVGEKIVLKNHKSK